MKRANKVFLYIFVPIILVIAWIAFIIRYIYNEDLGLMSLDSRYKFEQLKNIPHQREILKGDIISAEFSTTYPNLATIGIRFDTLYRISNDKLEFRLKEDGVVNWYYKVQYNTNEFQQDKIFPVSFPPIKNSAGKTFYLELESLRGTTDSAVAISQKSPTFVSRHVFTKESFLKDKRLLIYFIFKKIHNLFSTPKFASHFISYSLPLFFYLFFLIFKSTIYIPIMLAFFAIVVDILFIPTPNDFLIASIIFIWLLTAIKFNIESRVQIFISLIFTPLFPIFFSLGLINLAEKTATWAYLFFSMALIQKIYELVAKPKIFINLTEFWKGLKRALTIVYLAIVGEITFAIETYQHNIEWQKRLGPGYVLLLTFLRLGKPISVTRVYTTKIISILIHLVVQLTRLTLLFGPYILLVWLIWLQATKLRGYYKFYSDFFIINQANIFWIQIGRYLILFYVALIILYLIAVIFLIIYKKQRYSIITLLAILSLFASIKITQTIYDKVSSFQYDIVLWTVKPNNTAEPWVDVNIDGRNFKNLPFRGRILIDGVEQRLIKWSDNEIIFRTNPTTTKSGKIEVVTFEGKKSNTTDFKYEGDR